MNATFAVLCVLYCPIHKFHFHGVVVVVLVAAVVVVGGGGGEDHTGW